jgi:hypothetical protein
MDCDSALPSAPRGRIVLGLVAGRLGAVGRLRRVRPGPPPDHLFVLRPDGAVLRLQARGFAVRGAASGLEVSAGAFPRALGAIGQDRVAQVVGHAHATGVRVEDRDLQDVCGKRIHRYAFAGGVRSLGGIGIARA